MDKMQSKSCLEEILRSLPKDSSDTYSYIESEFKKFVANGKDLITIVVVGKTGVGKSRLVNALIGNTEAQEGNQLVPGTTKFDLYTTSKYGTEIKIWNLPGLEDWSDDLQQIADNIKDIDLLLYCVKMDDTSFRPQDVTDVRAIQKVIKNFGVEIWKNAMIVLTFANRVKLSPDYEGTLENYFIDRLKYFTDVLHEYLQKFGVKYDVGCVPVGDIGEQSLPICKDWRLVFCKMAIKIVNENNKQSKSFTKEKEQSKYRFKEVLRSLPKDISSRTYSYVVDEFKAFIETGKDSVTIALVGKTGVGKSRLVNALIGKHEAFEGSNLVAGTAEAALYATIKHGVEIKIWDTPGVEDGGEHEETYLQQIADNIKDIDLLLYCTPMTNTRIRSEDKSALMKVIKKLGREIWKNAIIVLTFANWVNPNSTEKVTETPEKYFEKRLKKFTDGYRENLQKQGVDYDVSCVPAGDIGEQSLPIYQDWMPVFWLMAFKMAKEKVRPALLQANHERLKFPSLPEKDYNTIKKEEIPIILNEEEEMQLWEMVIQPGRRAAIKGAKIGSFVFVVGAVFGAAGGFIYGAIQGLRKYYALKNAQAQMAEENDPNEDGADTKTESKPKPMIKPKPNLPKPKDQSSTIANPGFQSTSLSTLHLSNRKKEPPPVKPKPRKNPKV